jgi:hypothetical protein
MLFDGPRVDEKRCFVVQETQHKRSGHATTSDDAHLSGAEAVRNLCVVVL